MATDARISTAFPAHPKTKKLRRRLGDSGPLGCMYLFLWAAANRSDGDLSGLSDEDIELAVDWEGDHGALVAEMVAVGFLDGDEGSRRIHDWAEHNPWAAGAEARSEKSRWAALCKQHGRRQAARMMPEYAERMLDASSDSATGTQKSATGTPNAVPDSASGTPVARSGSAPSPSPSPSPSPKAQERPRKSARPPSVQFSTWLKSLPEGEDAIPPADPIFQFAADAGIPEDMLALAWAWFERAYTGGRKAKRYSDWRQVFRNAVEGNWAKVWRFTADGQCLLTSEGEMLRRALDAEARRVAA